METAHRTRKRTCDSRCCQIPERESRTIAAGGSSPGVGQQPPAVGRDGYELHRLGPRQRQRQRQVFPAGAVQHRRLRRFRGSLSGRRFRTLPRSPHPPAAGRGDPLLARTRGPRSSEHGRFWCASSIQFRRAVQPQLVVGHQNRQILVDEPGQSHALGNYLDRLTGRDVPLDDAAPTLFCPGAQRQQAAAVGAEIRPPRLDGHGEDPLRPPRPQIPEDRLVVVRAGQQPLAVRCEPHKDHMAAMPVQLLKRAARADLSDQHRMIVAAGGNPAAVGTDRRGLHRRGRRREFRDPLARGYIPHSQRPVAGRRQNMSTGSVERDRDRAASDRKRLLCPSRRDLPQHGPLAVRSQQPIRSGVEVHRTRCRIQPPPLDEGCRASAGPRKPVRCGRHLRHPHRDRGHNGQDARRQQIAKAACVHHYPSQSLFVSAASRHRPAARGDTRRDAPGAAVRVGCRPRVPRPASANGADRCCR
jgi:hypothetical protein